MFVNLAYGVSTMAICLFLEALLLVAALAYYQRYEAFVGGKSSVLTMVVLCGVMTLLVIGNLAQVGVWAMLFLFIGEFPDFNSAFYHSAVNFSTLGYGDIVMSSRHKLLGPMEAINGVLMIGVSTAVLMAAFQNAVQKAEKSLKK